MSGYKIISGVYKIQSKSKPEKVYIGSTRIIKQRWRNHINTLKANKHHSSKLQNHYNKYGEKDLIFEIIALCNDKELIPINGTIWIEQFFMWAYKYKNTNKPFFNSTPMAGSPRGVNRSQKFKDDVGNRCRGKKTGRPAWNKGIEGCYSQESINKRTESVRKFYQSENGLRTRETISKKLKGKKKPEGHGAHVSASIMGEKHHLFGKHISLETSVKMSLVRIGKHPKPESIEKQKQTYARNMKKRGLSSIICSLLVRNYE
jgi:group I intron endonuclease